MPPIRKIPCPLCSNPILPKYVQPSGTCITCEDGKTFYLREHNKKKALLSQERDKLHERLYSMSKRVERLAKEKAVKKAETKELVAERDRLREIYKEQASLALAKRSLLHYVERKVGPKYKAGWVHEDICRRIEKFVAAIERGESPRLILQIAPRLGKSEIISDCLPAWILGKHADWNIIITGYNDDLPTTFSRSIRDQLGSEEYRKIFPNGAVISKDNAAAQAWKTTAGGGVRAAGVSGTLIGYGCQVGIIDDPTKNAMEAASPVALENLWTWATSTLYSRLMNPAGLLVVAQRWSEQDVIGRFERKMHEEYATIERLRQDADEYEALGEYADAAKCRAEAEELDASMDKWDIIKYPALATSDQYLTPEGEIIDAQPGQKVSENWRLLRKEGESIHPERFTRNYYLKVKRLQPDLFSAMYQQEPISQEGAFFKPEDFIRYEPGKIPEGMIYYCAWDLAISSKTSADFTAGVCAGIDYKGNMWFVDKVHGKFPDVREMADLIIDMHKRNNASITGIEHTVISQALDPILQQRMRERKDYIVLARDKERLIPITDKQTRARTLQGLCRGQKVFVPNDLSWDPWIAEWTAFGAKSVHDDRTDSAAWCAILALRNAPPRDPNSKTVIQKAKSMWDSLFDGEEHKHDSPSFMES